MKTKNIFTLLIFMCFYWVASGAVLWWAYDFTVLIKGGAYQQNLVLALVAKMSFMITALTALIWILAMRREEIRSAWRSCGHVVWQTAVVLALYAVVILMRRQLWKTNQGINDWAMFFGYVNSRFFSEAGGISFLTEVVPIMAAFSGILYYLQLLAIDIICAGT